jgi:hypothetical protein
MRRLLAALLIFIAPAVHAQTGAVGHFHKVIVSPYIQVTFVQGDEESVTINQSLVGKNKLHVEVSDGTLWLYLDGDKDIPHNQQDGEHHHLYPDHAIVATVTYKKLDGLSLRGGEQFICQSPLSANKFSLRLYGDPTMTFTEVHIDRMHTTIYGESTLDIKTGAVNRQYYTCYGDGKINTTGIAGQKARVTAYGDGEFRVNVSDLIRIIAFGDARVCYRGNPTIVKGIHIGGIELQKLD